jgi:nucleotide-binding universal stress UspA family protein
LSEFAQLHLLNVWEAIGEDVIKNDLINKNKNPLDQYYEEVEQHHKNNLERLISVTLEILGAETLSYLKPQQHLVNGKPRDVIPAFTRKNKADLLVLGTVARTGIPGFFMGNTAETILNRLNCSVLAIKPRGFVTPVEPMDH